MEACHNVIRTISRHYNFSEELERSILGWDDLSKESSRKMRSAREGEMHEHEVPFLRRPITTRASPFLMEAAPARSGCLDRASSSEIEDEMVHDEDADIMIKLLQPRNKHTTIDHSFNCKLLTLLLRRHWLIGNEIYALGPTGCTRAQVRHIPREPSMAHRPT